MAEIVNSEITETKDVTYKEVVEAFYISRKEIVVHEGRETIIDNKVIDYERISTIKVEEPEVIDMLLSSCGINLDKIKIAIDTYKSKLELSKQEEDQYEK